jgi:hypothetical protein
LAWIVAVVVAIRLVFELLQPALPFLAVLLIVFAVVQFVRWYRGRW